MGSASSKPTVEPAESSAKNNGDCPVQHEKTRPSSGCPVQHQKHPKYNVYSQPIDPNNQMPVVANQLPSASQQKPLSTERVKSNIPKGGGADEGETWTYPSPQMFYNSLSRKSKLGDTSEDDIPSVVALHNNMNERTWNKVLEWEATIAPSQNPKLLKFIGKPSSLSPKARVKHWFLGHPLPFDRHDWTILREDGTTVRYVIDYYHDESRASGEEGSGMPHMNDFNATPSLLVDVRPALDSVSAVVDRAVKMPYARHFEHSTKFEPLPMSPTPQMKSQVQESLQVWDSIQKRAQQQQEEDNVKPEISKTEAVAIAKSFANMLEACREAQESLANCNSEEECTKASLNLTLCMGKLWCPLQHQAVVKALQTDDEQKVESTLETVSACVAGHSQRAQLAKQTHPDAFKS